MLKIGLTGNIAAGKTEVKKIFQKLGIKTICADSIVHNLFETNEQIKKLISDNFGENIVVNDNIDRKTLGKIVFSDETKKKELEKIVHPFVLNEINNFFEQEKSKKFVLVDIPLLFEGNFEYLFDKIILVYANDDLRFKRIKKRNNFDDDYIKKIMNNQISQDTKKEKSDFVIINEEKNFDELETEIKKLIDKIEKL